MSATRRKVLGWLGGLFASPLLPAIPPETAWRIAPLHFEYRLLVSCGFSPQVIDQLNCRLLKWAIRQCALLPPGRTLMPVYRPDYEDLFLFDCPTDHDGPYYFVTLHDRQQFLFEDDRAS